MCDAEIDCARSTACPGCSSVHRLLAEISRLNQENKALVEASHKAAEAAAAAAAGKAALETA